MRVFVFEALFAVGETRAPRVNFSSYVFEFGTHTLCRPDRLFLLGDGPIMHSANCPDSCSSVCPLAFSLTNSEPCSTFVLLHDQFL